MKIIVLIILQILPYCVAVAQRPLPALRDQALEQQVQARQARLATFLPAETEAKLTVAVNAVLTHLVASSQESDLSVVVLQEVNRQFSGLAPAQSNLLSFYVLAELSRLLANPEELEERLDSMGEMSETTSLRLQMRMDRRSTFISTLSNLMKKISSTQDQLVQNLK